MENQSRLTLWNKRNEPTTIQGGKKENKTKKIRTCKRKRKRT